MDTIELCRLATSFGTVSVFIDFFVCVGTGGSCWTDGGSSSGGLIALSGLVEDDRYLL